MNHAHETNSYQPCVPNLCVWARSKWASESPAVLLGQDIVVTGCPALRKSALVAARSPATDFGQFLVGAVDGLQSLRRLGRLPGFLP